MIVNGDGAKSDKKSLSLQCSRQNDTFLCIVGGVPAPIHAGSHRTGPVAAVGSLGPENAMMWIVKIALRAPYTFTVLAVVLLIGGALSALQMPKDIFPAINILVVGIIWTYNGLPAKEMAERIATVSERASTTTVNNIEHIESNSFNGIAVIKIYLQPGSSIDAAIAEVTASAADKQLLTSG
jgi:AcrB/AcrD/AcrF family